MAKTFKFTKENRLHSSYPVPSRLLLPDDMDRGGRWLVRRIVNGFMHLLFRMKYVNLEKFPDTGPVIVVSNHTGYLDIPAVHVNVKPWVYFLAKRELYRSSFGCRFLSWWGAVPIDRDRLSIQAFKDILGLLKQGKIISIFPEGHRIPKGKTWHDYPPRTGVSKFASRGKARILPMAIKGEYRPFHRITVTIGDPFDVSDLIHPDGSAMDEAEMAVEMMRRVYALNGEVYDVSPEEVRKSEVQSTP